MSAHISEPVQVPTIAEMATKSGAHQPPVIPPAPTLPEPRPDDEGRESLFTDTGPCTAVPSEVRCTHTACLLRERNRLLRALTPHPAPLGATNEGLRAAVEAFFAASDMLHAIPDEDAPAVRSALDRCFTARGALRAALQAGG